MVEPAVLTAANTTTDGEWTMLRIAFLFFVIALVAAFFGFGGVASAAADIGIFLFWIFVALFLITLLIGLLSGKRPTLDA